MTHLDSTLSPNIDNFLPPYWSENLGEMKRPTKTFDSIMDIDTALEEMKGTYKERLPYIMVPTLDGNCFRWTDIFVHNLLVAFATDSLVQFTSEELNAFWNFVAFEDRHSTSATNMNCNGVAIGCTIFDENNDSYAVRKDGTISNELCNLPLFNVVNEEAWKSIDKLLLGLYWCRPIDDCSRDKGISIPYPCSNNP